MKTFASKHGTVTVAEETRHFVVTGSSGYRAILPACRFDECRDGTRTPCATPARTRGQHAVNGKTSLGAWLAHARTTCHEWHWPSVERFAQEVLATYGARSKRQAFPPPSVPRMPTEEVAEALGLTVAEYRAELGKATLDPA